MLLLMRKFLQFIYCGDINHSLTLLHGTMAGNVMSRADKR